MTTTDKLGTLVWDTIADLSHVGETHIDLDTPQCTELRKAAYEAAGNTGDDRDLAYATLFWLQGLASFDALKAASRAYEELRLR
jgi:hypothetical protein